MMQVDHMTLDTRPSSLLSYSRIKPHFHSYWAEGLGTRLRKVGHIHGGMGVGQSTTLHRQINQLEAPSNAYVKDLHNHTIS